MNSKRLPEEKAKQGLLGRNSFNARLLESAPHPVNVVDSEGSLLYINPAMEQLTGYSKKEVIGTKPPYPWWLKTEEYLESFKRSIEHGLFKSESQMRMKNGELLWVEITSTNIFSGGKLKYHIANWVDITERKKAEAALKQREEQFRVILDNISDAVTIIGPDLTARYMSPSGEKFLGYKMEELTGRNAFEFVHPDDLPALKEVYKKGIRIPGYTAHVEYRLRHKDGSWKHVGVVAQNLLDNPEVAGIVITYRDITERKRAEEALRASEVKYRLLAENMADIAFTVDLDLRTTYVSPSIEKILGFTPQERMRQTPGEQLTPKSLNLAFETLSRVLQGESEGPVDNASSLTLDLECYHKNGSIRIMETSLRFVRNEQGKPYAIFGLCHDITERKRTEQELEEREAFNASLLESAPHPINVASPDGALLYINPATEQLTGYTNEEIVGQKPPFPWWIEANLPRQTNGFKKALERTGVKVERLMRKRNGEQFWVEITSTNVYSQGKPKYHIANWVDITERKLLEERLTAEKQRASQYLQITEVMIIVLDPDGKVNLANEKAANLTGYPLNEIIGKNWFDQFIHEKNRDTVKNLFNRLLNGELEQTRYSENTVITKSGEARMIAWHNTVIRDDTGKIIGTLSSGDDITERKRMEVALQAAERNFRNSLDSSPLGIRIASVEGELLYANQAILDIHGYSSIEELRATPAIQRYTSESYAQHKQRIERRKRGEPSPSNYEISIIRKDGAIRDLAVFRKEVMWGGKGQYQTLYRDITERKKAEEALKHAAEEWRTTFDSIRDMISIHDRDYKLVRVNKAFADAFMKKPHELIGKYCYELMHGSGCPVSCCPHRETMVKKIPVTVEFYEPHLGIYLEISTSPIFDEKGEVVGSVHISRDITKRKKMDEQLMLTDRLATIGELAAGVAHELNNPLTTVMGFSELLLEQKIDDGIRDDLKIIHQEALRTAGIVKGLLTFARRHKPVKELVDLNKIIAATLELRKYEQKVNNIEVIKQYGDLPVVMADYFQLQQVFLNIIINAEYFMVEAHGRGKLTVTTERLGGMVRIVFNDDGPGMTPESHKHLFTPFYTTKAVGKGTGLGLSICHGIVSAHGGKIYAESELGMGAAFYVELPISVSPDEYDAY